MNILDRQIIKQATLRLDKYPAGKQINPIGRIDKFIFSRTDKILSTIYKQKGMSGGMPYAYVQDMIPYSIGDDAKAFIKEGYNKNALVYAAINKITRSAMKAKFKLMDVSNPDNKKEITKHDILTLLNNPAPDYSKREFIEATLGAKLLTGKAFIYKHKGTLSINKGKTLQLQPIPPQYCHPIQDRATGEIVSYRYYDGRKSVVIAAEDMIYMRFWDPEGGVNGFSPLKAGREVLAHSNDAFTASRKLLINGGAAGILAQDDGTGVDFDDPQIDALHEKFRERYAGPENYNTPIITNGKWTWTQIGLRGEDMQLLEAQNLNLQQICTLYGFSSQVLNDPKNTTYNNMSEAKIDLILNCVIPHLHLWLDAFYRGVVSDIEKIDNKKYELVIDAESWEEIREKQLAQSQTLNTAYWMTLNEKRKSMGYEALDIPEGNDIYVPINSMPISTETDAQSQLRNAHAAVSQGVAPDLEDKPNE